MAEENQTLSPQNQDTWGKIVPLLPDLPIIDLPSKVEHTIGRSTHCDIVIDNRYVADGLLASISKTHLVIKLDIASKQVFVTDCSKNGTYINSERIQKGSKVSLNNGDQIALGTKECKLYVYKTTQIDDIPDTLTPADSIDYKIEPTKIPTIWGRLIPCRLQLESVDLINTTIKMGRSPDCDIDIRKMELTPRLQRVFSKEHCIVCLDANNQVTYITDLSKTGTYLNGKIIGKNKMQILQNDDTIAIAHPINILYVYKCMYSKDVDYLPYPIRKKYEASVLLGKGGAGEVRLAFEKVNCQMFAIKKIMKARSTTSQLYRLNHPNKIRTEISILSNLSHPLIIKMYEIAETPEEVFIVLDYMKGGELTNRILSNQPMTEQNVKLFFYQMAVAIKYLHSKGITHRDLKPENVLLATDDVETMIKVSDFGLSKITDDDDLMKTICGTHCYIAPEIVASKTPYNNQVDVWSLGVILFYMLSKKLPFKSDEKPILNALIIAGFYSMKGSCWKTVTDNAKDLIKKMLTVKPQDRITIDGILKHPWLSEDNEVKERVQKFIDPNAVASQDNSSNANNEPPTKRPRTE